MPKKVDDEITLRALFEVIFMQEGADDLCIYCGSNHKHPEELFCDALCRDETIKAVLGAVQKNAHKIAGFLFDAKPNWR